MKQYRDFSPPMQKRYTQNYRTRWESMEEFKGWLNPFPKDSKKAFCSFCHVMIKAHLCDLRKHGRAKKHKKAALLVRTLKRFREGQLDEDSDDQDIQVSDYDENASDEEGGNHWSEEAMESLIKYTKLHWKDLQDGLRKKKDVWKDISFAMARDNHFFNGLECDKKFRHMKEKYFNIRERHMIDGTSSYQPDYFEDLREMLEEKGTRTIAISEQNGEIIKNEIHGDISEEDAIVIEPSINNLTDNDSIWTETAVILMLEFLLEFKDIFTGNEGENENEIWQNVKEQMQMEEIEVSESQCRKKWYSLVKKYNECKLMMENTGVSPTWPHFKRVKHILQTVKIPTKNEDRFYSIKAKRGRKRGRKRKTFEETTGGEDSDISDRESPSPFNRFDRFDDFDNINNNNNNNNNNNSTYNKGKETLRMMSGLSDTASLWRRMDTIEARLDDLSDHHETLRQTNSFLSQILNEITVLSGHLSPVTEDPVSVQEGITIVVPSSEHSIP